MNITAQKSVLNNLKTVLEHLNNQSYTQKNLSLFGSSIGAHCRHIIEFYLCCFEQKKKSKINYDLRKRNKQLELNHKKAIIVIDKIMCLLDSVDSKDNTSLNINICLNNEVSASKEITSSFFRELIYCMDHCIHHQSLIKIALLEQGLIDLVDENFGVAFSTQIHRKTCVS